MSVWGRRAAATARSARFYFWPIIIANVLAMTLGAGGDLGRMAWFSLVVASIASFGFLVNDLLDRTIDLANRAGHLETSDRPTRVVAWSAAAAFCAAGLFIALRLGLLPFAIAAASASCLAIYSPVLRRTLLLPNVATAVLAIGPLWTPLVLSPSGGARWQWWLTAAMLAILIAREILMDVRDRAGDALGRRRTLATCVGTRAAVRVGVGLTAMAFVPFAVAVVLGARPLPPAAVMAATAVAGCIGYLVLMGAARIPRADGDPSRQVQAYVRASRLAMVLLPALGWLLAGAS